MFQLKTSVVDDKGKEVKVLTKDAKTAALAAAAAEKHANQAYEWVPTASTVTITISKLAPAGTAK